MGQLELRSDEGQTCNSKCNAKSEVFAARGGAVRRSLVRRTELCKELCLRSFVVPSTSF